MQPEYGGRRRQAALAAQIGANSLVGFLFLKILAVRFGTSAEKDGFDIAYSVPFIVMSVSGFTFLHSVITTQFTKLVVARSEDTQRAFATLLTALVAVGGTLALLCALFSGPIADLMAPGLPIRVRAEMQVLIAWMCPLVLTLGIGTYLSAVLNAHGVPVAMEFGQLTSRIGVIVAAYLGIRYSLVQVAMGLVLFSALSAVGQWVLLCCKTSLRPQLCFDWNHKSFRAVASQGGGFLVAAICAQISMSYMRRLGTIAGPGTTASMTYALSLAGPLTLIIGKPLALTRGLDFVRHSQRGEWREARHLFHRCVVASLAIGIVVAVVGDFYAEPIMRVLYRGGAFDERSVASTAELFRILNWTLPSAVLSAVTLVPLLNARRTHTAAMVHVTSYGLHMLLTWLLFGMMGRVGLAWAVLAPSGFQAIASTGLLYWQLDRRLHAEPVEAIVGASATGDECALVTMEEEPLLVGAEPANRSAARDSSTT